MMKQRCRHISIFSRTWLPQWFFWRQGKARFPGVGFETHTGFQIRPNRLPDLIFHDFGVSKAYFSCFSVQFRYDFRISFYIFLISFYILFHRTLSINAESGTQGGGGVSPPGVFDGYVRRPLPWQGSTACSEFCTCLFFC